MNHRFLPNRSRLYYLCDWIIISLDKLSYASSYYWLLDMRLLLKRHISSSASFLLLLDYSGALIINNSFSSFLGPLDYRFPLIVNRSSGYFFSFSLLTSENILNFLFLVKEDDTCSGLFCILDLSSCWLMIYRDGEFFWTSFLEDIKLFSSISFKIDFCLASSS